MKTRNLIAISIIILTLSCKESKKQPVSETNKKSEILLIENEDQTVYRKITELDKYKGFTEIVGMVLDGTDKALSYLQKDSLQVLVLEQIIRDNPSKVNFKILDEVQLIADKSKLFSEPTDCKMADKSNEKFIFGIAKNQDKEYFDKDHILKVWKIDLTENKFIEIESEKVKCFNHWFGYDEEI
ncbi:MAG: hypothetical protein U1C58_00400 [Flavobacteriaceae bacterium]|nr:hypothetical protein [Flavobacteriaceae bacterium]